MEEIIINYVIDRIEGEYAVLYDDNKEKLDILKSQLYPDPKEGDWIVFENGEYKFDQELTDKMRKRNSDLLKKLMSKG